MEDDRASAGVMPRSGEKKTRISCIAVVLLFADVCENSLNFVEPG